MNEFEALIFWGPSEERSHVGISESVAGGLNHKVRALLAQVEHRRFADVRRDLCTLLRSQDWPVVFTPQTLAALADHLEQIGVREGRKVKNDGPHIAKIWTELYRRNLTAGSRSPAGDADRKIIGAGVSRKRLEGIKREFRDFIDREKQRA